jgi:Na+-transporting NADH:ubiquinone oxidoreductase subunit C
MSAAPDAVKKPADDPDSIRRVITVALAVCLVCAIFVSGSVVALRPLQQANKQLDTQRNILVAAGLYHDGVDVAALFKERIDVRLVDLRAGDFANPGAGGIDDVVLYDQRIATKDPALSDAIPPAEDIAGLKRRAHYAKVYLIRDPSGGPPKVVLPISGYGLWSTLYGYLVLEGDLDTVVGITFTDHGETPGLGGEVDNPKWKAQWPGKRVHAQDGSVAIGLQKGDVDDADELQRAHRVDGLAGATLTSNGVNHMLAYWLGEQGFGPFLARLKSTGA